MLCLAKPRLAAGLLRTVQRCHSTAAVAAARPDKEAPFVFTTENFRKPQLPAGLTVQDVPVLPATTENLQGYGRLISSPDEISTDRGNFEIVPWPVSGWRRLDPHTGDEAGTTEGDFEVWWQGDYYHAHNLAIASINNTYLDGLGAPPEHAQLDTPTATEDLYLWMSDYHPDGAQLFWPSEPIPFMVCLGLSTHGDDIRPEHMRAFAVPAGSGIYLQPGTWHNGVYVHPKDAPARFLTRQGRVHARVSASWAAEFGSLLRVPLSALHVQATQVPGLATTYEILEAGNGGAAIARGSSGTLHATGVVKESGKRFWSTKDPGQQPFTCQYGVGEVITGWDQGCLGMTVGEKRLLTIPADEGYGAKGFPAWGIPPGATLQFTLECLKIA
tara:strand:+ start:1404 stop:2561 length:1158 start_codon:yes stop_codon:yes gene_type:complete